MRIPTEPGCRRPENIRAFPPIAVAAAMTLAPVAVMADAFGPAHYDPKSDQIIVTIYYSGTNPHHHFSAEWGTCGKLEQTGNPAHPEPHPPYQTFATIIDDQGLDAAKQSYTKTIQLSLAALSCRPVRVTLAISPVDYNRITIDIPGTARSDQEASK